MCSTYKAGCECVCAVHEPETSYEYLCPMNEIERVVKNLETSYEYLKRAKRELETRH